MKNHQLISKKNWVGWRENLTKRNAKAEKGLLLKYFAETDQNLIFVVFSGPKWTHFHDKNNLSFAIVCSIYWKKAILTLNS